MSHEDITRGPELLRFTPSSAPAVEFDFRPIAAPSLEGLEVTVPASADLTQEDLERRFHGLLRSASPQRPRAPGEPIALGDEVTLDVLGYCDGKLIPFSARFDQRSELAPLPALPGFAEALVGSRVGDSVEVSLTLPLDYPAVALQGRPVRFLVDLKAAVEVSLLGDDSPQLLSALDRGASLDEVMDSIREELEDEAADLLQLEGRELIFDALLERASPEVPDEAVSEEIRRAWRRLEGEPLARKNFDAQEQAEALEGWLTDAATRAQAERRLKLAVVLQAIVKQEHLTLTDAQLEERLAEAAEDFGLSASEVHQGLRTSPAMTKQMFNVGLHLLAVEHVLEHARIRYAEA